MKTSIGLENAEELARLNAFCAGKTVARIDYDELDNITLCFTDGCEVSLFTLGGVSICGFRDRQKIITESDEIQNIKREVFSERIKDYIAKINDKKKLIRQFSESNKA